ncbi:glycosyltransferase family 4 protein [Dechloromonas sp. A34]|uniref:glycosyltransferase family 4 protein n=1 Tax=Dechloromonas sp. A34 TaxID=447588 RepID=UPI0022492C69|nr:glycosyltransferase family 4 protein [Dechloromonas sp. A34]
MIELPLMVISALASLLLFISAWLTSKQQSIADRSGAFPIVMLVGPLPPPSGGMANQCEQLHTLLRAEGIRVNFVQTNAPYWPSWISSLTSIRAVFRLVPYLWHVWATLGRSQVVHLFANSGKAWYLFCMPVIVLSRVRGVPCIVNYRGGEAETFFRSSPAWVRRSLALASTIVAPSAYLAGVFRALGFAVQIIPNIINLERFSPSQNRKDDDGVHLIVTRNLEPIYDIPTALRTFAKVVEHYPNARLTIAGSGPEEARLKDLAASLGVAEAVLFAGRIPNHEIPALYASADVVLNPSTVDNMPISILESFASGVPVVSTNAGGIPFIAKNGENALLVPIGDANAMAQATISLLADSGLAAKFRANGLIAAQAYAWSAIRELWLDTYRQNAERQGVVSHA